MLFLPHHPSGEWGYRMPKTNTHHHQQSSQDPSFVGFTEPTSNYFRMPRIWTNITAAINNLAELKVVEYILRHTWGYQEYGIKKHITVDEFVAGRKRQNGSRMDRGTGLSERAVRYGLDRALGDGLIVEEVDATDRGRVKKSYALKMIDQDGGEAGDEKHEGVHVLHPQVHDVPPSGATAAPRSEKETSDRDFNFRSSKAHASERRQELTHTGVRIDSIRRRESTSSGHVQIQPHRNDPPLRTNGFQGIGSLLSQRREAPHTPRLDRTVPPARLKPTPAMTACMAEISRVLGDAQHLRSNLSQSMRLLQISGLPEPALIARLYEAMAITKDQQSRGVHGETSQPVRQAMPYFFRVVQDLLGLIESEARPVL